MANNDLEEAIEELRKLEEAAEAKRREIAEGQARERDYVSDTVRAVVRGDEDRRRKNLEHSLGGDIKSIVRDREGNVIAVTLGGGDRLQGSGDVLQRSVGQGLARAVLTDPPKSVLESVSRKIPGAPQGPPLTPELQAAADREREEFFRKLQGQ